jgi:hypothetical protein
MPIEKGDEKNAFVFEPAFEAGAGDTEGVGTDASGRVSMSTNCFVAAVGGLCSSIVAVVVVVLDGEHGGVTDESEKGENRQPFSNRNIGNS